MTDARDIPGFENKYQVTGDGQIYSVPRKDRFGRKFGGIYLKQPKDRYGYPKVTLTIEGRKQTVIPVHKLVALTFLGETPEGQQINHRDGNKENNAVDNLEFVTPEENVQHAWDNGLCTPYDRSKPYNKQGIIDSNKRRTKDKGVCGI